MIKIVQLPSILIIFITIIFIQIKHSATLAIYVSKLEVEKEITHFEVENDVHIFSKSTRIIISVCFRISESF